MVQNCRGSSRGARDRGGGVRGSSGGVVQFGNRHRQCYAILERPETEVSNVVIIGIVLIFYKFASVLFDPGFTFSYVSTVCFWFDIFVSYCRRFFSGRSSLPILGSYLCQT